jgi:hypothetical protein
VLRAYPAIGRGLLDVVLGVATTPGVIRASAAWRSFGSVEIDAGPDHRIRERFGHAVLGEMPVAAHSIEVGIRGIDGEVTILTSSLVTPATEFPIAGVLRREITGQRTSRRFVPPYRASTLGGEAGQR